MDTCEVDGHLRGGCTLARWMDTCEVDGHLRGGWNLARWMDSWVFGEEAHVKVEGCVTHTYRAQLGRARHGHEWLSGVSRVSQRTALNFGTVSASKHTLQGAKVKWTRRALSTKCRRHISACFETLRSEKRCNFLVSSISNSISSSVRLSGLHESIKRATKRTDEISCSHSVLKECDSAKRAGKKQNAPYIDGIYGCVTIPRYLRCNETASTGAKPITPGYICTTHQVLTTPQLGPLTVR
eukprot:767533-Pyramimonas_sp.AAC.1